MKSDESKLQQGCVQWFRMQYKDIANRLFAIPNGGHRSKKTVFKKGVAVTYSPTAVRLKKEGALAGVLDLFLAVPNRNYHGMFIEMKTEKGILTDNQENFISNVRGDYYCCVCRNIDQFMHEINWYLSK